MLGRYTKKRPDGSYEYDENLIDEAMDSLGCYEETGLTVVEIEQLKKDREYWYKEAKAANEKIHKIKELIKSQNDVNVFNEEAKATEMMEHVCDSICRYPKECNEDELIEVCAECKMGKFVCVLLNTVN